MSDFEFVSMPTATVAVEPKQEQPTIQIISGTNEEQPKTQKLWIISATLTVGGLQKGGHLLIKYATAQERDGKIMDRWRHEKRRLDSSQMDRLIGKMPAFSIKMTGEKHNVVVIEFDARSACAYLDLLNENASFATGYFAHTPYVYAGRWDQENHRPLTPGRRVSPASDAKPFWRA